jgi:hypothetical protein
VCRARTKQITEARIEVPVIHLELAEVGPFALHRLDDPTKAADRVLSILHKYVEDIDRLLSLTDGGCHPFVVTRFINA